MPTVGVHNCGWTMGPKYYDITVRALDSRSNEEIRAGKGRPTQILLLDWEKEEQ